MLDSKILSSFSFPPLKTLNYSLDYHMMKWHVISTSYMMASEPYHVSYIQKTMNPHPSLPFSRLANLYEFQCYSIKIILKTPSCPRLRPRHPAGRMHEIENSVSRNSVSCVTRHLAASFLSLPPLLSLFLVCRVLGELQSKRESKLGERK